MEDLKQKLVKIVGKNYGFGGEYNEFAVDNFCNFCRGCGTRGDGIGEQTWELGYFTNNSLGQIFEYCRDCLNDMIEDEDDIDDVLAWIVMKHG